MADFKLEHTEADARAFNVEEPKLEKPARNLPYRTPIGERETEWTKGQATWPEPLLGMTCGSCWYFTVHRTAASQQERGMGRCLRTAQLQGGKWAKQISGKLTACSEFAEEAR